MKLYYARGACSLVPRIIINELKLKCDYESVDLANKKTETGGDFLIINPKGSVPVLITDDGKTLTENAVILQFIVETHQAENLLPSRDNFDHYHVLEWINYITTELHKNFSQLFNPQLTEELAQKLFVPFLKNKFNFVNKHLEKNAYLNGDAFTLSDPYLYVMLRWAIHFKFDLNEWQHLSRFYKNVDARPAVKQALEQEGLAK